MFFPYFTSFAICRCRQSAAPTEKVKEPVESPLALQPATNGKLTILVVEDNKDMRAYIRSILAEYYNVLEASQGEEALTVLNPRTWIS